MPYKIAIADCKEGVFADHHTGEGIRVITYRGTDDTVYYGYVIATGEPISNPDYPVQGIYVDE